MSSNLKQDDTSAEASNSSSSTNNALQLAAQPETPNDRSPDDDNTIYLSGIALIPIFLSLCTTTFVVALDATIIATAIPTIASQFNSLNDISWYNAAMFLTNCAFTLPYGRAYSICSTKWVFLSAIALFEVGSAVCGSAPNSIALIIGRAIQGGALTTRVSWRWCFYINLPVGAVAMAVAAFCLPKSMEKGSTELTNKTWWEIFKRYDPIGTAIFIPSIICLLLALQWGGGQYPWSSPRVIATFAIFGVSFIAWAISQYSQPEENVTLPRSVLNQRSVIGACLYTFFGSASFSCVVFYLPIWFQAIRQDDAQQYGIHVLPLILSLTFVAIFSGGAVVAVGYYTPFLILGSVLMSVGGGLLYTLKTDASTGVWVGYQILFSAGLGMSLEQCNIAIQTVLPREKIPAGTSLIILVRSLGGSIAIAICQTVFEQKLRKNLADILPGADLSIIGGSGANTLVPNAQAELGGDKAAVQEVLDLYNNALVQAFLVALILGALTLPAALLVEWKSVKKEKREKGAKIEDGVEVIGKEKNGDSDGNDEKKSWRS